MGVMVVDGVGLAELRRHDRGIGVVRHARDLAGRAIRISVKRSFAEIFARQFAELPQVIGDVFSDIGDSAVGAPRTSSARRSKTATSV